MCYIIFSSIFRLSIGINIALRISTAHDFRVISILVPKAYDPSGLRQESRALGVTILK